MTGAGSTNPHQFLAMPDGRQLALRYTPGSGPGIVFLPGYMSDMAGSKATALFAWAEATGRECLLLDYSGCGASSGAFADGTLSRWREDVLAAIASRMRGRLVLVGSSMGGWLMVLVALELADKVAGLVGIAAAPDFTEWGFDKLQKAQLMAGKTVLEDNPYGPDPTPMHPSFWQDGQELRQLEETIPLDCPARLLHGQQDSDVPPAISLRLAAALRSLDVQVTLVKGGDHRLSRESDIALLLRTVTSLH